MTDYLHRCLALHGDVAKARYGRPQRLDVVERDVQRVLDKGGELWDVIVAIDDSEDFDGGMFGRLAREELERALKAEDWYRRWQELRKHEIVRKLFAAYRQIEPVSMLLRFICPERYGIYSSPVAHVLGIRPRRTQTATYEAYLESLRALRDTRHFERIADVEMALWALQLGVVDGLLKGRERGLETSYKRDSALRQMQAGNLTAQLFSERSKLDLAEALLTTNSALAGQIAGIEFEQLVGERADINHDASLQAKIKSLRTSSAAKACLHEARRVRNEAIHNPRGVSADAVQRLIEAARWAQAQLPPCQRPSR